MRSLLALGLIAFVMYACQIGDDKDATKQPPAANAAQAPAKPVQSKQDVFNELLLLEKNLTQAVLDGDISFLAKNMTEDFVLTGVDGKVQSKNEALADIKRERTVKTFVISDAEVLSFSEDSAVFQYTQNITLKNGASGKARITDTFVKRDGDWLVKSEQQTMMRK
ncbi:MAG TPA: nuclear transport factor 2 family protein [Pyrinomonadaceae bacterium]|nr:nuclear transport factor 2 family protein [Pyrinomonadaceae bacterium]